MILLVSWSYLHCLSPGWNDIFAQLLVPVLKSMLQSLMVNSICCIKEPTLLGCMQEMKYPIQSYIGLVNWVRSSPHSLCTKSKECSSLHCREGVGMMGWGWKGFFFSGIISPWVDAPWFMSTCCSRLAGWGVSRGLLGVFPQEIVSLVVYWWCWWVGLIVFPEVPGYQALICSLFLTLRVHGLTVCPGLFWCHLRAIDLLGWH